MTLSDTARDVLRNAAEQPNHFAVPPARLPIAAQRSVVQSMIKSELLAEIVADDDQPAWRTAEDGARYVLQATEAGLCAVGADVATVGLQQVEPSLAEPPGLEPASKPGATIVASKTGQQRPTLWVAAHAVLAAWDDADANRPDVPAAIEALRTALAQRRASAGSTMARQPRADTKRAAVLALLRRVEGATVTDVTEVTGWARHTVHGFLAGLKKKGMQIEVLDRVRQIGPGKQGAAGSYTVYRVAEAG